MGKVKRSRKPVATANSDNSPDDLATGNIKATRQDWLNVALDILITDGVGEVKVLAIGQRLGVSRSSFYWYFKSRQDLLDALLAHWEQTNTAALVAQSLQPADTITQAACNVFRCFVNPQLFNNELDFAVRDWARRSGKVRKILDRSDETRIEALKAIFLRFDYEPVEALTRARILYFMQLGYNVAELNEALEDRLKLMPEYLLGFTGKQAMASEIEEFATYSRTVSGKTRI